MDTTILIGIVLRVVIIFLGFVVGIGFEDRGNDTGFIWSLLGGIILAQIAATMYKAKNYPVQIDSSGKISFKNKEYQILFDNANKQYE